MSALPTLQSFIYKQPLNTFLTALPVSALLAYSVPALLAKTTNWVCVGCGWGQRQAAAVCSFPLFFTSLFGLSLGKIQGMDHRWFHLDAEGAGIPFETMTALWSLTVSAKVLMLSSDVSFFPVPAGDCSWQQIFDSRILYVISVGPSL